MMKIRIREDAELYYYEENRGKVNHKWAEIIAAIEGQILEVDTEYLFKDQFNTKPIPGISKNGLRIMEAYVTEVIDDERPGKARCNWCGKTSTNTETCQHCGKSEYLEKF